MFKSLKINIAMGLMLIPLLYSLYYCFHPDKYTWNDQGFVFFSPIIIMFICSFIPHKLKGKENDRESNS
jgi:hypothetical protein